MTSLLIYGNAKLGAISNFAIPPKSTCPGKNKFCTKYCYGEQNWYRESHVKEALVQRYRATLQSDFVPRMVSEIRDHEIKVVRIHTVGDFYSADYIRKWQSIVSSCPSTLFYAYTRSWRVPELKTELEFLFSRNFVVRASVDFTHKDRPARWPIFSVVDGEGKRCPHDLGKVQYCRDCGICWNSLDPIHVKVRWAKLWTNFSEELL